MSFFPEHFHASAAVTPLMWRLRWPEIPTPLAHSWRTKTLSEHLSYTAGLPAACFRLSCTFLWKCSKQRHLFLFIGIFMFFQPKKERIAFSNSA